MTEPEDKRAEVEPLPPEIDLQAEARAARRPLASDAELERQIAVETKALSLWYGSFQALFDVDLRVKQGLVTALIGPSGCGKSTLLRSVNRINERLSYVRTGGIVEVLGKNVYDADVELTQLRRRVGMVFQRPNPLPISVRDNVLFAFDLHEASIEDTPVSKDALVENVLKQVLLWDSVRDRLHVRGTSRAPRSTQKALRRSRSSSGGSVASTPSSWSPTTWRRHGARATRPRSCSAASSSSTPAPTRCS
jgi:ABC-type glutathione transport system ATPase component